MISAMQRKVQKAFLRHLYLVSYGKTASLKTRISALLDEFKMERLSQPSLISGKVHDSQFLRLVNCHVPLRKTRMLLSKKFAPPVARTRRHAHSYVLVTQDVCD